MITVVHIITKLELGGAQENTLATCRLLDRRHTRVALLHGPAGQLDPLARALDDVVVEVVPDLVRQPRPRSDILALADLRRRLVRLLATHQEQGGAAHNFIVHTHSSKAGILGRSAARAAGVPVVVHTIHGFGFYEGQPLVEKQIFVNAERAAAHLTDAFVGVSRANLAEAASRGILRPEHEVALIRSGFDLSVFEGAQAEGRKLRASLGFDQGDELIVCAANFKPQKDPLTLVEAMRIVCERRPRVFLLFAGDGPLRSQVEAAIDAASLGAHFRLLGWRDDIPALLCAADVVTLPSLFEGLPKVAVQAVAARRPFVGTRVDGTSEIIREGRNGFLVEPRSPRALADALERALDVRPTDEADRERIAEWDENKMVRDQEALYARLVDRARQKRSGPGLSGRIRSASGSFWRSLRRGGLEGR